MMRGQDLSFKGPATGADVAQGPTGASRAANGASKAPSANGGTDKQLSLEEQRKVVDLKKREDDIRQRERAHSADGAVTRAAKNRPDTEVEDEFRYPVKGEPSFDTSAVRNDPQATLRKMIEVHRAAISPSTPSAEAERVAAQTTAAIVQARLEIAKQQTAGLEDRREPANGFPHATSPDPTSDPTSPKQRSTAIRAYREGGKRV
jgi:hypothetical protein